MLIDKWSKILFNASKSNFSVRFNCVSLIFSGQSGDAVDGIPNPWNRLSVPGMEAMDTDGASASTAAETTSAFRASIPRSERARFKSWMFEVSAAKPATLFSLNMLHNFTSLMSKILRLPYNVALLMTHLGPY